MKRNINMGFRVTEQEQAMIRRKMEASGVSSLRAYLLKAAVDGYIVNPDLSGFRECSRLLRIYGGNVNQIAKRLHQTGGVLDSDIEDIKAGMREILRR